MQYHVEITERADRDLEDIYGYIHAEHSAAAAHWFNGLVGEILTLVNLPQRGTKTRENASVRQLLYGSKPNVYRIIFSIDEANKLVNVIHIRHGARRPIRKLP